MPQSWHAVGGDFLADTASQVKPAAAARAPRRRSWRDAYLGYFLIAPTLILIGVLIVLPLVEAIGLSFTDKLFINPTPRFVGLQNYLNAIQSDVFWRVVLNSLLWAGIVVVFQFLLGLGSALLLNRNFHGQALARALVILPWVTPGVVAGLLWKLLYDPYIGGVNAFIHLFGIPDPWIPWLGNPSTALGAVIFTAIWKGSPFSMVMYLAALQGVSQDSIEAALIDGANGWNRLWHVILPEIMPTVRITVLLTSVWTFNYFDLIYVLTHGGPGESTEIFPTYIYRLFFEQTKLGAATTMGVVSLVILLVFALFYIRELNRARVLE